MTRHHALSLVIKEEMQQVFSESVLWYCVERQGHRNSESQAGPNRLCLPGSTHMVFKFCSFRAWGKGLQEIHGCGRWLGRLETQWKSLPLPP